MFICAGRATTALHAPVRQSLTYGAGRPLTLRGVSDCVLAQSASFYNRSGKSKLFAKHPGYR
jgi:hypothetical protein